MNQEFLQLGVGLTLAVIIIDKLIDLIKWILGKKNNNGNKDNSQDNRIVENAKNIAVILQRINTIENNHLVHIQKDLDKNADEHDSMSAQLVGMGVKIDYIIEHIKGNFVK